MFQAEVLPGCVDENRVDIDGIHSCDKCNPLHHMLYPNDDNMTDGDSNLKLFAESSSNMSTAIDDLILTPGADDMEIEETEKREAPETIAAIAASNLMPAHVTKVSENRRSGNSRPR